MYKVFAIFLSFGLLTGKDIPDPEPFPEISNSYPLLWKSKTGSASFRTNVLLRDNLLIMGSNGSQFMDRNFYDNGSGLQLLSAKTGKRIRTLSGEEIGDMDVNGVLYHQGLFYFGNDNEEFQCMTADGRVVWRRPVSGDVEHEPVELDIKGRKAIVYATERGEARAVNPADGSTIWQYYVPGYDGWKPGENRMLFKVGAFFSNTSFFYTRPCVLDLNGDGVKDLVYRTHDNQIHAIDGLTGKGIWLLKQKGNNDYSLMMDVAHTSGQPTILVMEQTYDSSFKVKYYLITLNRFGKEVRRVPILNDSYNTGLNSLPLRDGTTMLSTSDSVYIVRGGMIKERINRSLPFQYVDWKEDKVWGNRNGGDPVMGTACFRSPRWGMCAIILNQWDFDRENSFIEILSLDQHKVVQRLALPGRSEMPPYIGDVNKDGLLDVLINCHDGYTYCYNLQIKA